MNEFCDASGIDHRAVWELQSGQCFSAAAINGVDRDVIFLSSGEKCVGKCSLKVAITMRLALFGATLNLPRRLRRQSSLRRQRQHRNKKQQQTLSRYLLVLKYLGGESLRGMATVQVTGCSTQPPKLKRVYASPGPRHLRVSEGRFGSWRPRISTGSFGTSL